MEPLHQVLERADVKTYIAAFKIKERKRLSDLYRKRFSLMFVSAGWQRAFHIRAMKSLNKTHKMDDQMLIMLNGANIYSDVHELDGYFPNKRIFQYFLNGAMSPRIFRLALKRLVKEEYIYRPGQRFTANSIVAFRIAEERRQGGQGVIYRISKSGEEAIEKYDRCIRVSIGKSAEHIGDYKASRLNALYFLLNEYLKLAEGTHDFREPNFRLLIDDYIKAIIDKVDNL